VLLKLCMQIPFPARLETPTIHSFRAIIQSRSHPLVVESSLARK
jgi:hypothetical protein